ncbi:MAG: glycosyltransferase family 2 protein [Ignavibacteriota bacterium]
MNMGLVSIIVLNYNGRDYLNDCLNSLLCQSYQDFEIILFDNSSSDNSAEFVHDNFSNDKIKIISSDTNLGFAGGNNAALKHAKGELIVLLNNDTVTDKEWLSELVNGLNYTADTGMVQSLVITEGIPLKYYDMNGTINLFGHNIMEVFDINADDMGEIFQVNGCSLIIRKDLLDKLGGLFPDEYFAYAEDTYLSFKVKFAGYKIFHNAKSVVHHKGSSTMKKYKNEFITFHQERNRLLNFLIFFSDSFRRKYYPLLLLNFMIKITYSLFLRKYSFKGIIKAYTWIISNSAWIETKQKELSELKCVSEDEILKCLSGKIANGDNFMEKMLNSISLTYMKLVNLKVIELY